MRKALIALAAGTVIAVAPVVSEVEAKKGGGGGRGGGGGASSSGGGGGGSGGSGKGGSARSSSSSIGSGGGGYGSSRAGNISGSVRGSVRGRVGDARAAWNGPRGELAVSRRARRSTSSLRGAAFNSPWYGAYESCYAWDQAGWQWLRVC